MEKLIDRAQKGDKEAFIDAVKEYLPHLYNVAQTRLKNDEDVGDAIQDTILAAFINLKTLKEPRYFKTWVIKILMNKCNDIVKRNSNVVYVGDYNETVEKKSLSVINENVENELDFKNLLAVLSNDYRIVIILFYVNGFTTREISEILNEKEGTIKSRLSRARYQLKEYYIIDNNIVSSNHGGSLKWELILMIKLEIW